MATVRPISRAGSLNALERDPAGSCILAVLRSAGPITAPLGNDRADTTYRSVERPALAMDAENTTTAATAIRKAPTTARPVGRARYRPTGRFVDIAGDPVPSVISASKFLVSTDRVEYRPEVPGAVRRATHEI
jgi:hypothetical protein